MSAEARWPKRLPQLTEEQRGISDDFMRHWHEILPQRYGLVDRFNHNYPVQHAPADFLRTLEVGSGLGEHLAYEQLRGDQRREYVALDVRANMVSRLRERHPDLQAIVADCQNRLPYADHFFDRVLAIHVLEHLPDLPAAARELWRVCNKERGVLSAVIPCEGGLAYAIARRISAQRVFEKRYRQPYAWLIKREHINRPAEILAELHPFFEVVHRAYFPCFIPVVNLNLCIGLTLRPKS
jgi:SAM-dependent methyltransferase